MLIGVGDDKPTQYKEEIHKNPTVAEERQEQQMALRGEVVDDDDDGANAAPAVKDGESVLIQFDPFETRVPARTAGRGMSTLEEVDHSRSQRGVREAAEAGTDIVDHVFGPPGSWNHARHGRMAEDELQQNLRPRLTVDLGRPRRQGASEKAAQQPAAAEWLIDDDGDAALGGQRKNALLCRSIVHRVVDLYEVDGLGTQDCFEFGIEVSRIMGDPNITNATSRFHVSHGWKLPFPIEEIVDLDEIDAAILQ